MKPQLEKWYIEELARKAKAEKLEKIGINKQFLRRRRKSNFSIMRFVKYIVNQWMRIGR